MLSDVSANHIYSCNIPLLLNDVCAKPNQMIALNHFSAVLDIINDHMFSTKDSKEYPFVCFLVLFPLSVIFLLSIFFQDVEAALHVFLDHATLSDHHIRIQLLKELAEDKDICIPHLAELTKTISTLLKVYVEYRMQFTMLRGTVRCGKCNYCYYQCYFYLCCDTNIIITNISLLLL